MKNSRAGSASPHNPNAPRPAPAADDQREPALFGVCRFCGCTDDTACLIHMAVPSELVPGEIVLGDFPCAWLVPDVCTAPACVEKAYLVARLRAESIMEELVEEAA